MMSGTKSAAIWDEVQGSCDATKLQRALETLGDKQAALDGWTPLHYVCENRSVDDATRASAIRALAKYGVDANAVDEHGWTALHLLCKNKHADELAQSLQALLASGANASLTASDAKKTALLLLCENELVSVAALSALVKVAATINTVDSDGNSPLHNLTENSSLNPELLAVALAAKADANIKNQFQSTPFHSICQHSGLSVALVRAMLQHKANPNLPNNIGNTPFHYACENYALTVEILHEFLNSKQVNLTTTNSLGKTALELIPSHKQDCIAVAQRVAAPSLGSATSLLGAKDAISAGGEDASELPAPLDKHLTAWNKSLPPFDMAFYNAVCCEPAFATLYEQVQDVSVQVCESPSDSTLLKSWEQALAKWRTQLLLAFTALVPPELWDSYAEKYGRTIPSDITKVRSKVIDVWTRNAGPAGRRERFEALGVIFQSP